MTLLTSTRPTLARDIDGKAISAQVLDEVREEVLQLATRHIYPALAVVLVALMTVVTVVHQLLLKRSYHVSR